MDDRDGDCRCWYTWKDNHYRNDRLDAYCLGAGPDIYCWRVLNNLGTNAHAGKGKAFVIEADEYDHMFLGLKPKIAVITNIEHDHPDCYPTPEDFFKAFDEFATQVGSDGTLVGLRQ